MSAAPARATSPRTATEDATKPGDAASKAGGHGNPETVVLCGVDIASWPQRTQLILLSSGALFCALAFAALQEKVINIEGFKHHDLMTVVTTITFVGCAWFERIATGDRKRKADLKDYALLSVFTFMGMWLTNWSLVYLTYPTRILFKSSKVVPVMLASVVMTGRKYSAGEYFAAVLLVLGISMFTIADAGMPSFNILGVVLISGGVLSDAITANLEERMFRRLQGLTHAEVVMFSSLFGAGVGVLTMLANDEVADSVSYASEHPEMLLWTVISASTAYGSVSAILLLIRLFGSTVAEIVKSCRKVLSIVISFLLYAKPVMWQHVVGGTVFVLAVLATIRLKAAKARAKAPKAAAYEPVEQVELADTGKTVSV